MFQRTDEGFSLVEAVIAIFLLMVLSLAVLPLAVRAVELSVDNRDNAAATAFANEQLAAVKAWFPPEAAGSRCSEVLQAVRDLPEHEVDPEEFAIVVEELASDGESLSAVSIVTDPVNGIKARVAVTTPCPTKIGTVTLEVKAADSADLSAIRATLRTKLVVTP